MISPNGIHTILFDLDGTLRHNRPSSNQVFFDFAVETGLPDSADGRVQALRWAHYYFAGSGEYWADREHFGGDEERFWLNYAARYLVAFGCPADLAPTLAPDLHQRMRDEYRPEDWVPPDVPSTLGSLQTAGFTLGVVSNRSEPVDEYLESLALRGFLDFTLTAGQVDSWKPDRKIFQRALQDANAAPHNCVYVGDNYYADIVGARRAGLHPVLVDPDQVFPEVECPVVHTIGEFLEWMEGSALPSSHAP